MFAQKLFVVLSLLFTLSCTEDLGAGKSAVPNLPQSPPTENGWSLKSIFQFATGSDSGANGGGVDAQGNFYSVGYGMNGVVKTWIVRKSNDKGKTWTVVDTFNYSPSQESNATAFAADQLGNIFVVGVGIVNMGTPQYYWIVRKSSDAGATWTTVDAVTGAPGFFGEAAAITVSSTNRIFVTGVIHNGTKFEWPTRMSNDNGSNWTTVATYSATSHARGYGIVTDTNGVLYVCGAGIDGNNKYHWLIAKSPDNGTSWTQVENFQLAADSDAECRAIAVDKNNRILAAGNAATTTSGKHWVVKRSNVAGTAFTMQDDFVHPSDSQTDANSSARAIAIDSANNYYVAGYGSTFLGAQKYISVIRKSVNGGVAWTVEDAYQPVSNADDASANTISIDSQNRVFISGQNWIRSWNWFIRGNP